MNPLSIYIGRKVRLKLAGAEGVVCGFYGEEFLVDAKDFHSPVRTPLNDSFIEFLDESPTLAVVGLKIDEMWELARYHKELADARPVSSYEMRTMSGKLVGDCVKEHRARARWFSKMVDEIWPK